MNASEERGMRINEVESLVGVTKKNIRFYEEEGLLTPGRNQENRYREYGTEDVAALLRIKLFRKLGVPIPEIRAMQQGRLPVGDCAKRHLVFLEHEIANIENAKQICTRLTGASARFSALEAEQYLEQMEQLEQEGAHFMDVKKRDTKKKRMTGAILAGSVMILLMLAVAALYAWLFTLPDRPPVVLMVVLIAIPLVPVVGVGLALKQRIKEIKEGEEDAVDQY